MGLVVKEFRAETVLLPWLSMERLLVIVLCGGMLFYLGQMIQGDEPSNLLFLAAGGVVGFILTMKDPHYPKRTIIQSLRSALVCKKKGTRIYDPLDTIMLVEESRRLRKRKAQE